MNRVKRLLLPALFALLACALCVVSCGAAYPGMAYIHFDGEINKANAKTVVKALGIATENHASVIVLDFTTNGGLIPDGMKIAKAIELSPTKIVCVVDGRAESMGFALLQSCDVRVMTRRSFLMAHAALLNVQMQVHQNEADNMVGELRAVGHAFAVQCAHRLKISQAEYDARVADGREWYLQPDEALAVGAVDAIADDLKDVIAHLRTGTPFQPQSF